MAIHKFHKSNKDRLTSEITVDRDDLDKTRIMYDKLARTIEDNKAWIDENLPRISGNESSIIMLKDERKYLIKTTEVKEVLS